MADSTASTRRTRPKGADATARSEALQRLKALRSSTSRRSDAGFQIKMEDPIYDTVDEEDYAALVARRRDDFRDFIVDDDGLGYTDVGQEEDWSNPNFDHSSCEEGSDGENEGKNSKTKKKSAVKKDPATKKPPPVSSVKQRISSMFTSSVFKKNDRTGKGAVLGAGSIIDDVLAEFAPDEKDREERRRRGLKAGNLQGSRTFTAPIAKSEIESETTVMPNAELAMDSQENEGLGQEKEDIAMEVKEEVKEENALNSKAELGSNGSGLELEMVQKDDDINGDVKLEEGKKGFCLNAKIKVEKDDTVMSATDGWKAACGADGSMVTEGGVVESSTDVDERSEFDLDSGGKLPFYIIDAQEEAFGANMGTLYLFGKVKAGGAYYSCCVVVNNMQRCIYAIPDNSIFQSNKIEEMERNVAESRVPATALKETLQEAAAGLKNEIAEKLLDLNVSTFSMMPVKRGYAFERSDVPTGEHYVLKISYPFKDPPMAQDLKGEHFTAVLGTHSSALELFLVKRKIMGPSWLSISRFVSRPTTQRVSWCKFEIVVDCAKDISISAPKIPMGFPPVTVTVAAINLKTIINEKHNTNEIVAASVVCCHKAKIDSPMMSSEWKRKGVLSHFTVVRKLDGGIFPMGLANEVTDRNSKAGSNILTLESSERALLNRLMTELHKLDCDVLVGHNISGFDLDVLLHRAQACKVPSSMWSKIGRLKRSVMPKLSRGSSLYGSGASLGIMSCIAGRLLCDTYLCARDLLREVSYSLTQLAKTQLNKDRKEIAPHDIPSMFQASRTLLQLVEYGETDAWLSLELMFHLSILPLTRQLTNISGNLWGKTLQGARAQRVEYLLLHEFHAKKYMVPDKITAQSRELNTTKRKITAGVEAEDADGNDVSPENDGQHIDRGKGKKGPAYSGGLVLEPKKGLYDKYILLLDFNSLYPSIIQEYNICFTTVERSSDGLVLNLPPSEPVGVLPKLLKHLVESRKTVRTMLKTASGIEFQQLDIRQQALKLTANSMYGCLGFSNSRFYAKPLAELITLQGREILQSTVDLVQNNLNLEVVYGDTDSIMIYTGLDDIAEAEQTAKMVMKKVNQKYRRLEIGLDGLYKRMLLLKKKKYAAVKVQRKGGMLYEAIERKGLDMVRRDWSLLSKEIGDFCLSQILSGGTCEDVVESIHSSLMKVQQEMRSGEVALEKYVITKSLTKPPEDYPDAKNQPHVQVALRLKKNGYTGCSAGDTIPYIICCQQDASSGSTGIAQRARHPDELKRENSEWMIDIDYYLSQQIHPVVSRLCASIQGTSPARLADCLGLDSSKFQNKTSDFISKDPSTVILSVIDDDERYNSCEPLRLSCPSCSSTFECPPVSSLVSASTNQNHVIGQPEGKPDSNFWHRMRCPRCPDDVERSRISPSVLANQVKRQAENFVSMYYRGTMMCDDELCRYTTRTVNLRVISDAERGTVCPNFPRCHGHLVRQYTEADLYRQLSYICYALDTKFTDKLDQNSVASIQKELAVICPAVAQAASEIQKIRDRCAYGWVQLKDLCISL